MRGGDINSKTSFVILCTLPLWREMDSRQLLSLYFIHLHRYSQVENHDTQINSIHANQLLNAISPPSYFFELHDIIIRVIVHVLV